jgi:hypothetical protein
MNPFAFEKLKEALDKHQNLDTLSIDHIEPFMLK